MSESEIVIEADDKIPTIEEVELEAHDRDTGHKAVVDKSTMDTICVVPKDNYIIQHKHVLEELRKLDNFKINNILLSKAGARMEVELREIEPNKIELLPDDFLECGAKVYNDYSIPRGLSVSGFGMRLVCSNGMVAPKVSRKMAVYAYGTNEFSTELLDQLNACFAIWQDPIVLETIKEAAETEVSVKDIIIEHDFLPGKYMKDVVDKLKDKASLYDIYNAFTEVITHTIAPNIKSEAATGLLRRANKIIMPQLKVTIPEAK